MKIAFIDFVLDPSKPGASGLSDVVWNMARELAKLGDEVHIVAPYAVDPEPVAGIAVHRFSPPPLGYRNIIGHVLIALKAWSIARRIPGLDVIHAPEYLSTGVIAPLSKTPVVLTTPGNVYERIANGNPFDWSTTQVYKLAARSSARSCTLIDAISEDMAWWWARTGTAPARLEVIPHGVDTAVFHPIPQARAQLGLGEPDRIVLYVGRLSPEKNVDVLIQAMACVRREAPDAVLHILGDGPDRGPLEGLAREAGIAGAVIFHGALPLAELPLWYSAADVAVLPSSSEGLPRVMLEAMSSGTAFVGTEISGIRDHVRDGETGFLVPVGDADSLARRIALLLGNDALRDHIGTTAARYAREHLAWPVVMQRFRTAVVRRLRLEPVPAAEARTDGVGAIQQ